MNTESDKLLIISPGGMACTYVAESLQSIGFSTNCPKDKDLLKHSPLPKAYRYSCYQNSRKIYVWNDPLAAILSLHRRGWLLPQQRKLLGKQPGLPATLAELWRKTLEHRMDVFGIQRHFANWFSEVGYDKFWLDYRYIDLKRTALAKFLGRPAEDLNVLQLKDRGTTLDTIAVPLEVQEIYRTLDLTVQRLIKTQN